MYYSKENVEQLLQKNLDKLNECILEVTNGYYGYSMLMQFQQELLQDLKNIREERKILE